MCGTLVIAPYIVNLRHPTIVPLIVRHTFLDEAGMDSALVGRVLIFPLFVWRPRGHILHSGRGNAATMIGRRRIEPCIEKSIQHGSRMILTG